MLCLSAVYKMWYEFEETLILEEDWHNACVRDEKRRKHEDKLH